MPHFTLIHPEQKAQFINIQILAFQALNAVLVLVDQEGRPVEFFAAAYG